MITLRVSIDIDGETMEMTRFIKDGKIENSSDITGDLMIDVNCPSDALDILQKCVTRC